MHFKKSNSEETTGYLIENEIAEKILKSLKTVTNEKWNIGVHREIPKQRCIPPKIKPKNYWRFRNNVII